jgi:hypothetical protein
MGKHEASMSSPRAVLRGRHRQYATADSVDPARAQARSAALRPTARAGWNEERPSSPSHARVTPPSPAHAARQGIVLVLRPASPREGGTDDESACTSLSAVHDLPHYLPLRPPRALLPLRHPPTSSTAPLLTQAPRRRCCTQTISLPQRRPSASTPPPMRCSSPPPPRRHRCRCTADDAC